MISFYSKCMVKYKNVFSLRVLNCVKGSQATGVDVFVCFKLFTNFCYLDLYLVLHGHQTDFAEPKILDIRFNAQWCLITSACVAIKWLLLSIASVFS